MALQPRRLPLLHRPGKSRGGAAPQMRHPLGSGAALPVLARSRVAGSSQDGSRSHYKLQEPKKRAGSTRSSRRRLPAVPARAALTASFLGVSAGGGPATLRPESCRSRAGATASRSAPGPPPGSPAPGPALSSPLRPQPYPPEAGARGLQASRRPAAPGARAAGYRLPREKRQASLPRVAPRGQSESDFGFAPPGLCRAWETDPWKREGIGPARVPLGGMTGGYTALVFLCWPHLSYTLVLSRLTVTTF